METRCTGEEGCMKKLKTILESIKIPYHESAAAAYDPFIHLGSVHAMNHI